MIGVPLDRGRSWMLTFDGGTWIAMEVDAEVANHVGKAAQENDDQLRTVANPRLEAERPTIRDELNAIVDAVERAHRHLDRKTAAPHGKATNG